MVVLPQPGQLVMLGAKKRYPIDWSSSLHTSTSRDLGIPGSGVKETLMVSPIPSDKSIDKAAELETIKLNRATEQSGADSTDEQKIRQYIQKRAEMKKNCDGMWSLRGIGGKSNSEIIALCKPLGYDVKSKTWRYEPESVKKLLRKYGIYD